MSEQHIVDAACITEKSEITMRTKTKNEIRALMDPYVQILNQCGATFLSPVWSVKEIMGKVYSSQKQIHFQEFVEGIAYHFANNSMDKSDVEALVKKVSDSTNHETMTSILDSVFFSHCKISRTILGIITGKLMRYDKLDYEDMVLVNALRNLFDDDLSEFWRYTNHQPTHPIEKVVFLDHCTETDRLIVEKLQNAGVLGRDLTGNRLGGAMLRFEPTIITERLKSYLDAISPAFIDL